jgi:hypothetical protein
MSDDLNNIRVELADQFRGETVVLLTLNDMGAKMLRKTLEQAKKQPRWPVTLKYLEGNLIISVIQGQSTFEFTDNLVYWRLPIRKISEINTKLDSLISSSSPSHHYVDIAAPVGTLVISKNEYS